MSFETKDSGAREEYPSGMRRDTQDGKARWDLLFVPGVPYDQQPLYRVAELMRRGAEKYGDNNWVLADSEEELARFKASAARHFAQWMAGETDEDHGAATWYNIQAVMVLEWKLAKTDSYPIYYQRPDLGSQGLTYRVVSPGDTPECKYLEDLNDTWDPSIMSEDELPEAGYERIDL